MNRQRWQVRIYRVLGIIFVIAGVQWLIYDSAVDSLGDASQMQLAALRVEVIDNREANAGLRALQEAWNASTDDEQRRVFVALRDRVSERFLMDREAAMADFIKAVDTMTQHSEANEIRALRQQSSRLSSIYANRSEAALKYVEHPPWYLQPTASLMGGEHARKFGFNVALHELFVGELDAALERLVDLRQQAHAAPEIARIDYALARLHLDRYTQAQAMDGLGQSLALVKESLRNAPEEPMALLLLDYLLAVDSGVDLVDMETAEGEGVGQGDGKRGALDAGAGEF